MIIRTITLFLLSLVSLTAQDIDCENCECPNENKTVVYSCRGYRIWTIEPELLHLEKIYQSFYNTKKTQVPISEILEQEQDLNNLCGQIVDKIESFIDNLDYKIKDVGSQVNKHIQQGMCYKKHLVRLAKTIKAEQGSEKPDKQKLDEFTNEFRRYFNKFNINERYENGLGRNLDDYLDLNKKFVNLTKIFVLFHELNNKFFYSLHRNENYQSPHIKNILPRYSGISATQNIRIMQQALEETKDVVTKLLESPFSQEIDEKHITAIEKMLKAMCE